jgi:hypothetical protein
VPVHLLALPAVPAHHNTSDWLRTSRMDTTEYLGCRQLTWCRLLRYCSPNSSRLKRRWKQPNRKQHGAQPETCAVINFKQSTVSCLGPNSSGVVIGRCSVRTSAGHRLSHLRPCMVFLNSSRPMPV